jgi:large subunit ribosomal protein L21
MDEQELYQGALEEALDESDAVPLEAGVEELTEVATTAPQEEQQSQAKVTTNFESMTLAELKGIAKQRGLSGISSMKRSQLLEALKPKVLPADGGILSALAEQGSPVESS